MIETKILLHAIEYRITITDTWTVIFTESSSIGGRPGKFMMHRAPMTIWYFEHVDGWGNTPAAHIVAAYEWCLARLGDDFALERLPVEEVIPHKWRFREAIKMTICDNCWKVMSDHTRFLSCKTQMSEAFEDVRKVFDRLPDQPPNG